MDNINLKLIRKQQKYYLTSCSPVIVELLNDCPEQILAIRIPKYFKKWDTIFCTNNIEFIHKDLCNVSSNNDTRIVDLESCYLIYLKTSKIVKRNKLCITKIEIEVKPNCLNEKYLNNNISLNELSNLVCAKEENCFRLQFLDEIDGIKGDKVRLVVNDNIVGVKLLGNDGEWQWVARAGGTGGTVGTGEDAGYSISAGPNGDVFVTGLITNNNDSIKFYDGGDSTPSTITTGFNPGNIDKEVFVAKINDGKWQWVANAGGIGYDEGRSISAGPNCDVFVTGNIQNNTGEIKFYDGGDSTPSTITTGFGINNGFIEVFVAKIDNDGKWRWVARAGGTGSDQGRDISAGPNGDVFVTGYIENNGSYIKFYDGGESTHSTMTTGFEAYTNGDEEVFVAKINDNSGAIIGILNNNADKNDDSDVCFPYNKIESDSMYKSGKNYYKDKDDKITDEYLGAVYYYGTCIEDGKIILFDK